MKVLVFGGTHGNEWTGATIVTQYLEHFQNKYLDLNINFILANPEAYKLNRRFKDEDLNRAFQFLHESRNSYEHHRAREIRELIKKEECFVIDLHTTTSNMGSTIILPQYNSKNFSIAWEVQNELPNCRIIGSPDPKKKYLGSQSDFGLMVEVGPVANGIIDPIILNKTIQILDRILLALSKNIIPPKELEIFEEIQECFYPLNEDGDLTACIHSDFQGKDFIPIEGEYTPFQSFNGQTIHAKTNEILWPIFINEAAYYPNKLAYVLCRKTLFNTGHH